MEISKRPPTRGERLVLILPLENLATVIKSLRIIIEKSHDTEEAVEDVERLLEGLLKNKVIIPQSSLLVRGGKP